MADPGGERVEDRDGPRFPHCRYRALQLRSPLVTAECAESAAALWHTTVRRGKDDRLEAATDLLATVHLVRHVDPRTVSRRLATPRLGSARPDRSGGRRHQREDQAQRQRQDRQERWQPAAGSAGVVVSGRCPVCASTGLCDATRVDVNPSIRVRVAQPVVIDSSSIHVRTSSIRTVHSSTTATLLVGAGSVAIAGILRPDGGTGCEPRLPDSSETHRALTTPRQQLGQRCWQRLERPRGRKRGRGSGGGR
mmetsp:Transcript_72881/g.207625  ORF Transcript_72881/g.207625 Transcript_72881/m.207625 type:complete len:251 (+) Transcript_72881:388-1140(+)